jgi:hypothetical protein
MEGRPAPEGSSDGRILVLTTVSGQVTFERDRLCSCKRNQSKRKGTYDERI